MRHADEEAAKQDERFLAAWVEDLLQNVLQQLAKEYHAEGKGDYFRVLYGRMCERMSIAEVAESARDQHQRSGQLLSPRQKETWREP